MRVPTGLFAVCVAAHGSKQGKRGGWAWQMKR